MTEIRVGLVTENHYPSLGGMEIAGHHLAIALGRQPSTRAAVAATGPKELPRGFSYPYRHYRAPSFSVLTPYLRRWNLHRMMSRERVNVLHGLMLHGGGARAAAAAERHGIPLVVGARGADIQEVAEIGYGASLDAATRERIGQVVARADRIVALSRISRELLLGMGADPGKVVVIPNGVAFDAIDAVPPGNPRPGLGIAPGDFVLLTVSRASPVKRTELLYRALAIASRDVPSLRCISVGPRARLEEAARAAGAQGLVVLTGEIRPRPGEAPAPELVRLYRAADLFVSVSYVESFSNAALEALACGTPALVTPRHGEIDVMREGETGFVARDETPEGIARLLVELAGRRRELARMRPAIRASVAHLTWDHVAARLRDLYLSIL